MAKWAEVDYAESYEDGVQTVLEGTSMRVDPRKVLWCNYPAANYDGNELEEKVRKDTKKLEKEIEDALVLSRLFYVGIPRIKLVRRGVSHLVCEVDLYYVACDTTGDCPVCWWGSLVPKADNFDFRLWFWIPSNLQ